MKPTLRRMRAERCPDRVLEKVNRAVAAERTPALAGNYLRWTFGAATAILIVSVALLFFRPGPSTDRAQTPLVHSQQGNDEAGREIYGCLASFGLVLHEAASRSGTIILQETLPSLRQGLETARNAIKSENKP